MTAAQNLNDKNFRCEQQQIHFINFIVIVGEYLADLQIEYNLSSIHATHH